MFAHAAQAMGYRVCVLDPDQDSPAGTVAEKTYLRGLHR
jgi:5-(carboxyamino)imidazole ribonucleotide synthase